MKSFQQIEYGDFQTPPGLAALIAQKVRETGFQPQVIIEPTCGIGEVLMATTKAFPNIKSFGVELNSAYCDQAQKKLADFGKSIIINANIFDAIQELNNHLDTQQNFLFIGNPPWVTNSQIGALNGTNLPKKHNIKGLRGIHAITGKSNFDLAESIILRLINQFSHRKSFFAFLCKTIVARNILESIWKAGQKYSRASIYKIDSLKHFQASVDACFFMLDFSEKKTINTCDVFESLISTQSIEKYGFTENRIVREMSTFLKNNFIGKSDYIWRNGVKHDCAKVMELTESNGIFVNSLGEEVDIEYNLVYPFLKSSDISKPMTSTTELKTRKFVIVTQQYIGQDTNYIKMNFPKTYRYLLEHEAYFIARKSSIYKGKPPFSIFSIGSYSFSPFKIAISGLYKKLQFSVIPPIHGRSVLLDDTCNFISCYEKKEAMLIYDILTSRPCQDYLQSLIFWDSKRPITTEILNTIDLKKISQKLNYYDKYMINLASNYNAIQGNKNQGVLF